MSLLLFLVIIDKVMRAATKSKPGGMVWTPNERLEDLYYADDAYLLSHTNQDMQSKLNDLIQELQKLGWPLENECVKCVEHFFYLGSNISADGGASIDVDIKISTICFLVLKSSSLNG